MTLRRFENVSRGKTVFIGSKRKRFVIINLSVLQKYFPRAIPSTRDPTISQRDIIQPSGNNIFTSATLPYQFRARAGRGLDVSREVSKIPQSQKLDPLMQEENGFRSSGRKWNAHARRVVLCKSPFIYRLIHLLEY